MVDSARILIIDDDPIIRMLAGSALSDVGHLVTEAQSAEAAIDMLTELRPDLIVLDLLMPGMGGLVFCAWLRARPEGSRLPVLVMTALDGGDTIRQAFDAGASDFIPKPFNPGILAHRVRFLLRARDTMRALEASRRNLQEAQHIAHLGSWELNRISGEAICSDGLFKVLDRDPATTPATLETFMRGVHADDVDRVRQAIAQAIEHHEPLDVIHRFMTRDGAARWIQLRVKFEYDAGGHAVRSYGTVQDLTEQHRIEERLDYLTRHDPVTGLADPARAMDEPAPKRKRESTIATSNMAPSSMPSASSEANEFYGIARAIQHCSGLSKASFATDNHRFCEYFGVSNIGWVWFIAGVLAIALYYPVKRFSEYKKHSTQAWIKYL